MKHSKLRIFTPDKELADMTAIILAGGLGNRLRSIVADRPKVLAEVQERPFLAYLLDQLNAVDIKYVVLCTGYRGEQVRSVFGEAYRGIQLVYSQEPKPLGTAGALRFALSLMKSDPVLVMNGDSFCHVNLRAFLAWHRLRDAEATLLLNEAPDTERFGRVWIDEKGLVLRFEEKGQYEGPGWINAGIYLLKRRLIEMIPTERAVSIEGEVFPILINHGLYGYQNRREFLDIGTPDSYAAAEEFFAQETQR